MSRSIKRIILNATLLCTSIFTTMGEVRAEDDLLRDRNGDGEVVFAGFGDSITYGVGDGTEPGEEVDAIPFTDGTVGYVQRVSQLMKIQALNLGVPGEVFTLDGINRFVKDVSESDADIIGIMEGANDAIRRITEGEYGRALQKAINVTRVMGKTPVLFTLPPACCEHAGARLYTDVYNGRIRHLARVNGVAIADAQKGWITTCDRLDRCNLYNLPEGLHPNSKGYDVISQVLSAALYKVDLFAAGGAAELASALGVSTDRIVVKPEATDGQKS